MIYYFQYTHSLKCEPWASLVEHNVIKLTGTEERHMIFHISFL